MYCIYMPKDKHNKKYTQKHGGHRKRKAKKSRKLAKTTTKRVHGGVSTRKYVYKQTHKKSAREYKPKHIGGLRKDSIVSVDDVDTINILKQFILHYYTHNQNSEVVIKNDKDIQKFLQFEKIHARSLTDEQLAIMQNLAMQFVDENYGVSYVDLGLKYFQKFMIAIVLYFMNDIEIEDNTEFILKKRITNNMPYLDVIHTRSGHETTYDVNEMFALIKSEVVDENKYKDDLKKSILKKLRFNTKFGLQPFESGGMAAGPGAPAMVGHHGAPAMVGHPGASAMVGHHGAPAMVGHPGASAMVGYPSSHIGSNPLIDSTMNNEPSDMNSKDNSVFSFFGLSGNKDSELSKKKSSSSQSSWFPFLFTGKNNNNPSSNNNNPSSNDDFGYYDNPMYNPMITSSSIPSLGQPNQQLGQPNQQLGQPNQQLGQPNQPLGQPNQPLGQPNQPLGQPNQPLGQPNQPLNTNRAGIVKNPSFKVNDMIFYTANDNFNIPGWITYKFAKANGIQLYNVLLRDGSTIISPEKNISNRYKDVKYGNDSFMIGEKIINKGEYINYNGKEYQVIFISDDRITLQDNDGNINFANKLDPKLTTVNAVPINEHLIASANPASASTNKPNPMSAKPDNRAVNEKYFDQNAQSFEEARIADYSNIDSHDSAAYSAASSAASSTASKSRNQINQQYKVGDDVTVNRSQYKYPGWITFVYNDNTYNVNYRDGGYERKVDHVKLEKYVVNAPNHGLQVFPNDKGLAIGDAIQYDGKDFTVIFIQPENDPNPVINVQNNTTGEIINTRMGDPKIQLLKKS
uniref:Uncharacterized protein n=1 Tax=viral metagenome TaxID=1070528 RepID=A0A6C0HHZ5_9ZZZZ